MYRSYIFYMYVNIIKYIWGICKVWSIYILINPVLIIDNQIACCRVGIADWGYHPIIEIKLFLTITDDCSGFYEICKI